MKIILILSFFLLIASCGKSKPMVTPTSSTVSNTYEQKIPGTDSSLIFAPSKNGFIWSQFFTNKISTVLDSGTYSHILDFNLDQDDLNLIGCPNFNKAQRAERMSFWIAYLATISNIESGYATNFWVWDRLHKKSAGLLMVSSEDADEFLKPLTGVNYSMTKLLDPSLNIESGIGLLYLQLSGQLSNQSTSNKLFYFDSKTLWNTVGLSLRTDKNEFLRSFGFYTNQFQWCRQ